LNSIATKVNLYNKTSQLVDNLYTAQDYQGTYLLQQEDSSANAFKANIAAVIKLIAELTPEVSDPSLLDLLAKLKSNIVLKHAIQSGQPDVGWCRPDENPLQHRSHGNGRDERKHTLGGCHHGAGIR
jgi:hypothetical protein